MTNRVNKYIKEKFAELRKSYICARCNNPEKKIEFAHRKGKETELKGSGRGRKERYYDILKNPDHYIPLCKECHKEYDQS